MEEQIQEFMVNIKLYDVNNIDELVWPETEEYRRAKELFVPYVKIGVSSFITNVETILNLIQINQHIIPITINHEEYHNSYVVSSYFCVKRMEELLGKKGAVYKTLSKPLTAVMGNLFKKFKINKVLIVNNWLSSTNLYPNFSEDELKELSHFLHIKFPEHAIMFRSLNEYVNKPIADVLKNIGYRLINSRDVFFYDPQCHHVLQKRDCKRDLKLLKNAGYEIIEDKEELKRSIPRLLELYQSLYIKKYTKYSPNYSEDFLRLAIDHNLLHIMALKKNGRIDGVTGFFKLNGHMVISFFGYDTSLPQDLGIYRMLNILGIQEATFSSHILNQSSGAAAFKKVRGLVPYKEYIAISVSHLPWNQKSIWVFSDFFINKILSPILDRFPVDVSPR